MDGQDFLEALARACRTLREFLAPDMQQWLRNVLAAGHAAGDVGDGFNLKPDRIFEILCYFTLLSEISNNCPLACRLGNAVQGYRLPYGPADKPNFAYFRFVAGDSAYDFCCGTALPVENEPDEHPDISLQEVDGPDAGDEPGSPVAIWDAKHHKGALAKTDIAQMVLWCQVLNLAQYHNGDILTQVFAPRFQVSGILTNADHRPPYQQPLLNAGCSVVLNFFGPQTGDPPSPSREEHLAHQAAVAAAIP